VEALKRLTFTVWRSPFTARRARFCKILCELETKKKAGVEHRTVNGLLAFRLA